MGVRRHWRTGRPRRAGPRVRDPVNPPTGADHVEPLRPGTAGNHRADRALAPLRDDVRFFAAPFVKLA